MTHPIPGADSEREAFETWAKKENFITDIFPMTGQYQFGNTEVAWLGWQARAASSKPGTGVAIPLPIDLTWDDKANGYVSQPFTLSDIADRAAAKVGANVAAKKDRTILIDTIQHLGEALLMARDMVGHPDNVAFINRAIALAGIRSPLAAGAPAETPKPTGHKPPLPEADRIGPLGERLFLVGTLCNYGTACAIAAQPAPAPIAGDVEKDAAPEIDYNALVDAAEKLGHRQGTRRCVAFKHGAEWFRAAMLANSSSGEAG